MPAERLQKILAQAGHGSRRSCEELITAGRVRVNGEIAILGQRADPSTDTIQLDWKPLAAPARHRYILLNKPRGVIASRDPQGDRQTVYDIIPDGAGLFSVGRLDVDSEGLLLLTNDGALTQRMAHPRYEHEKEYEVLVRAYPDEEQLAIWRRGVVLPDGFRTAPAQVTFVKKGASGTTLSVVMREGHKRQIREMGGVLGLPVQRLRRIRFGTLTLGGLQPGEWRDLTSDEVARLQRELYVPVPRKPMTPSVKFRRASTSPNSDAHPTAFRQAQGDGSDSHRFAKNRPTSGSRPQRNDTRPTSERSASRPTYTPQKGKNRP